MKEQIDSAVEYLKTQNIEGCITGSALLDYFEGQDIDVFVYNEQSFNKLLFALHYNPMFQLLEPIEKWKFDDYVNSGKSSIKKFGLISVKFKYNLAVDVNVVFKKTCTDAFSVISSFDLNIICKAFDIRSKQTLDLTGNTGKVAYWNKWNVNYYETDIWGTARLLRQLERCFKYHKRGYNTDNLVNKYIEIIGKVSEYEVIFNSDDFKTRVDIFKGNLDIVKQICEKWLETHEINEEALAILKEKTKQF